MIAARAAAETMTRNDSASTPITAGDYCDACSAWVAVSGALGTPRTLLISRAMEALVAVRRR